MFKFIKKTFIFMLFSILFSLCLLSNVCYATNIANGRVSFTGNQYNEGHYGGALDGTFSSTYSGARYGYINNGSGTQYTMVSAENVNVEFGRVWNIDSNYSFICSASVFNTRSYITTAYIQVSNDNYTWYNAGTLSFSANERYTYTTINSLPINPVRYFRINCGSTDGIEIFEFTICKKDTVAPTAPTINPSTTNWTNGNVPFTIIAGTDNGFGQSGISSTKYQVDGGTWNWFNHWDNKNLTIPGTIYKEGIHTINAQTIDNEDNKSGIATATVKIDRTAPTAPTITPNTTNWTNSNVTFTIANGADSLSGVAYSQYQIDGGAWTNYGNTVTVSSDGIHTINARTIDNVGNISANASTQIKIDRAAPTVPIINPSTIDWTNGNVTFTLTNGTDSGSGIQKSQYQIDGGTWTDYSSTVTISNEGIHTINARTIDNAGNVGANTSTQVKIDRTAPTVPIITPNTTNWSNEDVMFTITPGKDDGSGQSGIDSTQYQVDGGTWNCFYHGWDSSSYDVIVGTISDEGVHIINIKTIDKGGNTSSITTTTVKIDRTVPTAPTINPSTTNWTNGNITFTVNNGTDSGSGVKKSQYQIDGGAWTDYGSTIIVSTEGVHTINAKTIDNAGNVSSIVTSTIKIDKTIPAAPTITGSIPNGQWINVANFSFSISGGSDSSSGISYYQYQLDGGAWTKYSGTVTISNEGYHSVYARAVDNAGNISSPTGKYQIGMDRTIPTTPTINPSTTNWTNSNVTFTIVNGTDSGSGVRKSQYQIDGGAWIDYSSTVTISNEGVHTINARTIDNIGNISSIAAATVKIDKTIPAAPNIIGNIPNGQWINIANFNFSISGGSDSSSGISYYQYQLDGGAWTNYSGTVTVTNEGYHCVYARTVDNAGNISSPTGIYQIGMDRTIPKTPTINPSTTNWTNSNVTFTITNGADLGSGVKKSQYQIDGGTWTDYSSTVTISNEGVHTINAKTIDNVGNVGSISAVTVKIDKTISYAVINPSSYDGSKTNINYNTNPTDINLAVHLTNIKDNLSGVANIKVWFTDSSTTAATLPGTYFNFDIAASTSNKDLAVNLPSGDFNRKNIHFQIIDNAGNISHYCGSIKLEALAPKAPILSSIKETNPYVKGDNISISWTYVDNNAPALPQNKAELIFTNAETGEVVTKTLSGSSSFYQIPVSDMNNGITRLKIRIYNSDNKYSESSEKILKINRFIPTGRFITKTIELADNIEFVSVKTDYSKPAGTNIKCTLYYWNKDAGCFDENHKLIIDNNNSFIRLPYSSNKFKIKYDLSSTDTVNVLGATYAKISPYITSCKLMGK